MESSLADKTLKSIESISTLKSIESYYLVGGTALSLQIKHRLSEDLDFMRWPKTKEENTDVNVKEIEKELTENGHKILKKEIFEKNHIEFLIDEGVKLSFYCPNKREPKINIVSSYNNIKILSPETIGALKLETLLRRSYFRDYYDLYFIFKDKSSRQIIDIIDNGLKYSGHIMKSKNLLGKLINPEQFRLDAEFKNLEPISDINSSQIAEFMKNKVVKAYQNKDSLPI